MLSRDEKKAHVWIHEDHDSPLAREEGAGLRAGIFLLEGRYHVAAHSSPFGRRLVERGALHVANLVVDPTPAEQAALSGGACLEPKAQVAPLGGREMLPVLHRS